MDLESKRDEIIKAALAGGKTYETAKKYARQHVPDELVQEARREEAKYDEATTSAWKEDAERKRRRHENYVLRKLFGFEKQDTSVIAGRCWPHPMDLI